MLGTLGIDSLGEFVGAGGSGFCANIQGVQMAKSPHWNAIPVKNRLVFRIRKLRIVYQGKLSAK